MQQLVHCDGRRNHSKCAQQIMCVFLRFNLLWYFVLKVFFFFNIPIVQNSKDNKREDRDNNKEYNRNSDVIGRAQNENAPPLGQKS